jgi:hypothetical protein
MIVPLACAGAVAAGLLVTNTLLALSGIWSDGNSAFICCLIPQSERRIGWVRILSSFVLYSHGTRTFFEGPAELLHPEFPGILTSKPRVKHRSCHLIHGFCTILQNVHAYTSPVGAYERRRGMKSPGVSLCYRGKEYATNRPKS